MTGTPLPYQSLCPVENGARVLTNIFANAVFPLFQYLKKDFKEQRGDFYLFLRVI